MSRLTLVMFVFGAAVVAGAIAWWWLTYGEVIGYGYLSLRDAGGCLLTSSDLCSLAKSLCFGAHPRQLYTYWTSAFWTGAGLVFAGFATLAPARPRL